jgi:hypothetical protein
MLLFLKLGGTEEGRHGREKESGVVGAGRRAGKGEKGREAERRERDRDRETEKSERISYPASCTCAGYARLPTCL